MTAVQDRPTDQVDPLADDFWQMYEQELEEQQRRIREAQLGDELWDDHDADKYASVVDASLVSLRTFYAERVENGPRVSSVDELMAAHLACRKGRRAARRRHKFVDDKPRWTKLVARGEQLTNEHGEPVTDSNGKPISLRLTRVERRALLLNGTIPDCAELRKYRADELKQLKAVRKGYFITRKGEKVPLAKHKAHCLTAPGRAATQLAVA